MNTDDIKAKVDTAQSNVDKINNTIEKYKKQLEKKIIAADAVLEKYNRSERYSDIKDDPGLLHRFSEVDRDLSHDFYWAICDIHDKESGIESNKRKLKEAEELLKRWKEKLGAEEAKIQFIQDSVPEIIKSFLDDWKQRVINYYLKKAESYPEDYKAYREEKERVYFECLKEIVERLVAEDKEGFIKKYCYSHEQRFNRLIEAINEEYKPSNSYEYHNLVHFYYTDKKDPDEHPKYRDVVERFNAKYGDGFFRAYNEHKFDKDWLDKAIEEEKKNKLVDLMNRVMKITGTITDARGLYLENGDINGFITGERGKAKVQTIGAGGYNEHVILESGRRGQCYHFRVLVNEIR